MADQPGKVKQIEAEYSKLRIPIGPVHPALKEPFSLKVTVQKEEILDVDIKLGHVFRGIEALAESRNLYQTLYLVERICGICSHSHTTGYIQALEEISGIAPSPRALYLRTLIFELERLQSHLFVIGIMAYEIGFDTLFMLTWNFRENVLDLFEDITGNRIHHSMNTIGGVRWDLTPTHVDKVNSFTDNIEKAAGRIHEVFQEATVEKRLGGVGVLERSEAQELCVVGPTARGSGVKSDVRKDYPYAAYEELKDNFSVAASRNGDSYARIEVRISELFESISLVRAILDALPTGPILREESVFKLMKKVPEGETISMVEAPRGELFYYVRTDGEEGLSRLRVRTPTMPNVLSLRPMLVGCEIADIPVVASSIDPCMACANRVTIINQESETERVIDWHVLQRRRRK